MIVVFQCFFVGGGDVKIVQQVIIDIVCLVVNGYILIVFLC